MRQSPVWVHRDGGRPVKGEVRKTKDFARRVAKSASVTQPKPANLEIKPMEANSAETLPIGVQWQY
jgi:hypothetical protein